jgi:uncharacterized membrane protein YgcG
VGSGLGLRLLTTLTQLTSLDLGATDVASAGLSQVARLTQLRVLGLGDCEGVGDPELRLICSSGLTSLTRLCLRGMAVGDRGAAGLSGLGRLRALDLDRCRWVGPAGLAALAALGALQELSLSWCATAVQPAQLAQLGQLAGLTRLVLKGHGIRGEAATALLELPRLAELAAASVAAGDGGAAGGLEPGSEQRPRPLRWQLLQLACPQLAARGAARGEALPASAERTLSPHAGGRAITRLVLTHPRSAELRALLPLPALQSLTIGAAPAGLSRVGCQAQLTRLAVGDLQAVSADELCAALQGLRQLRLLELEGAGCFDEQCLLAVAAMQQLTELWLSEASEVLGGAFYVLQHCGALRRLTLQSCAYVGSEVVRALARKAGMEQVVLRGWAATALQLEHMQQLGARHGCEVLCLRQCESRFEDVFDDESLDSESEGEEEESDGEEEGAGAESGSEGESGSSGDIDDDGEGSSEGSSSGGSGGASGSDQGDSGDGSGDEEGDELGGWTG